MIPFALGVLLGALFLHQWALLPVSVWWLALWPTGLLMLAIRRAWAFGLAGILIGMAVTENHAQRWLQQMVTEDLTGVVVELTGTITGLPEHDERRSRFLLRVDAVHDAPNGFAAKRLRVTAFPAVSHLRSGDRVQLRVRLRPPRGLHNAGLFDYAAWLYREDIHGLASVRGEITLLPPPTGWLLPPATNGLVPPATGGVIGWPMNWGVLNWRVVSWGRLREQVRASVAAAYPEARHPGVLNALIIGDRSSMAADEWRQFLHTGTNHLIAISGLHIGLVAGFAALLAGWLWRFWPWLQRRMGRPGLRAGSAMMAAAVYAGLAGFSVPTQRALIMLILVTAALWLGRNPLSWRIWALALAVVVILHPPHVLAAGFWFSFLAVATILLFVQGRVGMPGPFGWLRLQIILAMALLPMGLAWFQLGTWIAPVANLLAVPLVSFIVLPSLLVGAGLALIHPGLGWPFILVADALLAGLLSALEQLLRIPGAATETSVPWGAVSLAGIGVMLLFLPRLRLVLPWLLLAGGLLLIPLRPSLDDGAFRAELIDVGQGLAVLVQTRHHALLYDAGPAWPEGFDAGAMLVLPVLRRQRVAYLDRIIVSHEHLDHRGGVAAVVAGVGVGGVFSRRGDREPGEESCHQGQQWSWDGVEFEILHPPRNWDSGNAASCVLRISNAHTTLLLTGDLEGLGETVLVRSEHENLAADVLLVPHHGAAGVLTRGLLEAANPTYAWVSRGYDNRFGHPRPEVRERLRAACVPLLDSAERGGLVLDAGVQAPRLSPGSRLEQPRFWRPVHRVQPDWPSHCGESLSENGANRLGLRLQ